jgi:hypothetical protein
MPRKIRSDSELQEAALHVKYEIEMLTHCTEYLSAEYASTPRSSRNARQKYGAGGLSDALSESAGFSLS